MSLGGSPRKFGEHYVIRLLVLILGLQSVLLTWAAYTYSPTWDEVGHLAAGVSHWYSGKFELYPVNPPLIRTLATGPVALFDSPKIDWAPYDRDPRARSEVLLGRKMIADNGISMQRRFVTARLVLLPIALLGTTLCFCFSKDLFGSRAGLLSAFLWAFSPNSLGYGAVLTPDLASAVSMLGVCIAFYKWLYAPTWAKAVVLGTVTGVAMLVKSIWIIFPPLLVAMYLGNCVALRFRRQGNLVNGSTPITQANQQLRQIRLELGMLFASIAISTILVNGFYGFRGSLKLLGKHTFYSELLAGERSCKECSSEPGNRFKATWLAAFPVPLPERYVVGIDIQRRDFESGGYHPGWKSYFAGQWKQGGWWYYYFLGVFLKESLALWGLFVAACLSWFLNRKQQSDYGRGFWCLAVPSLVMLAVVSANTGLNRYLRYALPVLPMIYIWISQLLYKPSEDTRNSFWSIQSSKIAILFCSIFFVSTLRQAPNWLSYFNLVAGGSSDGYRLYCDSNADWGQDLFYVKNWLDKHPEAKGRFYLAYFGSFNPMHYGIDFQLPTPLKTHEQLASEYIPSGWYAISVNYLVGHPVPTVSPATESSTMKPPGYDLTYFQSMKPIASLGEGFRLFYVQPNSYLPENTPKLKAESP